MLNESQNRIKREALFDESISNAPARCIGWLATIPTTLPFSLPYPTTMFGANNSWTSKNSWSSTIELIISFMSYGCKGFSGMMLIKLLSNLFGSSSVETLGGCSVLFWGKKEINFLM